MANSGPRTNGSQFFFTFRATAHLDGKHTVFGKLVGGEEVLDIIERLPVRPTGDRPAKEIKIIGVQVLTDPFEAYQTRLAARLARQDQSDEALKRRDEAKAEREKDRTTWLGTNLGAKGESKAAKEARKRKMEEDAPLVGKYLKTGVKPAVGVPVTNTSTPVPAPGGDFGMEKKKKKAGGFGDFSGW